MKRTFRRSSPAISSTLPRMQRQVTRPRRWSAVTAADVSGQVADAITATLKAHGCRRGSWQDHLLCGALAAVVQAMKAAEDQGPGPP